MIQMTGTSINKPQFQPKSNGQQLLLRPTSFSPNTTTNSLTSISIY